MNADQQLNRQYKPNNLTDSGTAKNINMCNTVSSVTAPAAQYAEETKFPGEILLHW